MIDMSQQIKPKKRKTDCGCQDESHCIQCVLTAQLLGVRPNCGNRTPTLGKNWLNPIGEESK